MTSVLNVDTIADKAGTGPVGLTKQVAAKAHVTGSDAAAIVSSQSFNITSGTDHGTGDYSYAFTSNLDNASYSGAVSPHGGGLRMATHSTVRSTTSVFAFYVATDTSTLSNHGHSGAAFGDLA